MNTLIGVPGSEVPDIVVPLHWRVSCEGCKWSVDDVPAGDAVIVGGGSKPLAIVDTSFRLAISGGSSEMVRTPRRCSSWGDVELSVSVWVDVLASSRPHIKASAWAR